MDLSSPMRSLVPSLDSSVLEVLSRSESALGTTQIARLAGRGSRAGLQLAVDRLVEHGLVLADPTNRGFVYRLNRSHVLLPAVLAAASVRAELLSRLSSAVQSLTPTVVHASVFGSFARGDGDPSSDIDLFLLVRDGTDVGDELWTSQMRALEDDVHAWTGNRLETVTLDEAGLNQAVATGEVIVQALLDDGLVLAGPRIRSLLPSSRAVTTP